MGGQPTTVQQVSSQSQPWAAAQPALKGILSGLQPSISGAGSLNPVQQSAIGGLLQNAQAGNPYAGSIGGVANSLLSGGGANNQAGMLSGALSNYQGGLAPFENSSFLNPMNTPGFSTALNTLNTDITNQINGQFAGVGRDMSGANAQALARGLSQGEAGLIANQYNQNVQNQLSALGSGYNAANSTGGLLSGLQQQSVQNQQAGIPAASSALSAQNYGPQAALAAEAQAFGIPISQLGGLAGIAQPIAGLGGQSSGTQTTTQQIPLSNQIIGGGIGSLGLLGQLGGFGQNGWLYNPGGTGLLSGIF